MPSSWQAIVNRVSDAANPIQSKACQAILTAATIWGLPVFNGPVCYSVGCNKVLHHQIFSRAGLQTPRSVMVRFFDGVGGKADSEGKDGAIIDKLLSASNLLEERGCQWPLLIKPNSAGFGSGIALFNDGRELALYGRNILSGNESGPSNDGLALLQEYIQPTNDLIYRVWFLGGKVQCATKRFAASQTTANARPKVFSGGCAGSGTSCEFSNQQSQGRSDKNRKPLSEQSFTTGCLSRTECALKKDSQTSDEVNDREIYSPIKAKFTAWTIPVDVQNEIEVLLKCVGPDCHAGSVEFLYTFSGERIYFDLNMLSTLPATNDGSVENPEVWPGDYNPWLELAENIKQVVLQKHSKNVFQPKV